MVRIWKMGGAPPSTTGAKLGKQSKANGPTECTGIYRFKESLGTLWLFILWGGRCEEPEEMCFLCVITFMGIYPSAGSKRTPYHSRSAKWKNLHKFRERENWQYETLCCGTTKYGKRDGGRENGKRFLGQAWRSIVVRVFK